jgi:hypothetical protein
MKHTYINYENLLALLYHEMPLEVELELYAQVREDPELLATYHELFQAKMQFPQVMFNPSKSVIQRILQYSTKTS